MEFAYMLRPAFDQAFVEQASPEQRAVFDEHGTWLEARFAEGRVLFAGRCYDGPFGLVVLDVADEDEARRLVAQDPSVREGVQTAELYPFRTFLAREHVT
jgi:uncharacterized protein YciI